MRKNRFQGRKSVLVNRLNSACQRTVDLLLRRRLHVLLPLSAGAFCLARHAQGQVSLQPYSSGTSFFSLTLTPDTSQTISGYPASALQTGAGWKANSPENLNQLKFQLPLTTGSTSGTGLTYDLSSTYSAIGANGQTSSTAIYGGLEAVSQSTGAENMSLSLLPGTGITQTNTGKVFQGSSEAQIYVDADWSINSYPAAGYYDLLTYQFPLAGVLGIGGSESFTVNLTFTNTSLVGNSNSTNLFFTGSKSNPGTQSLAFTNNYSGIVTLNNGLPLSAGNFAITGTISFQASNDQSPSFSMLPQSGMQINPQLTVTTFVGGEGDSWENSNNWQNNVLPGQLNTNGVATNTALFNGSNEDQSIVLSNPEIVAGLEFADSFPYELASSGAGQLVMQNTTPGATAFITATNTGAPTSSPFVTLAVPLILNSPTQISVDQLDEVEITSPLLGNAPLNVAGPGTVLVIGNQSSYTGTTTISGGTLQLGGFITGVEPQNGSIGAGPIVDNSELILNESVNQTLSNPISGNGSIVLDNAGTVAFTGNNSQFGGTAVIDSGSLQIGNSAGLGSASVYVGSQLDLNGNNVTLTGLSGYGVVNNTNGTFDSILTIANSTDCTFSGTIQNTGAFIFLTKAGLGTLDLQDFANAGATTINAGTLALDGSTGLTSGNVLSTPNIYFNGGTLKLLGGESSFNEGFLATTVLGGPNAIDTRSTPHGASITLGALNRLPTAQGGVLQFLDSSTGTITPFTITDPSNTSGFLGATFDNLAYSGFSVYGSSDWTYEDSTGNDTAFLVPGSAIAGFYVGPTAGIFPSATGPVPVNADVNLPELIQVPATETLTSVRFNTPNGGLTTTNGNSMDQLIIATGARLFGGAYLVTPNVGANNVLITGNSPTSVQSQALNASNASGGSQDLVIWQNNTAGLLILNTGISDGLATGNGLTKAGPGNLVLNATSTYTGPNYLEGGTTEISANNALGGVSTNNTLGAVNLNGGSLMAVTSLTLDNGGTIKRNVVVGPYGGALIAASGQTLTVDGSISDSGNGSGRLEIGSVATFNTAQVLSTTSNALSFGTTNGNGTVILTGSLGGFTGPLVLASGTLQVGNGSASGSLGTNPNVVTDNGNLMFDEPAGTNLSLLAPISGIGGFEQMGAGSVTLSGYNTYAGLTLIGAGATLNIASVTSLPGNGTIMDNGTLNLTNGNYVLTDVIAGSGGVNVGPGASVVFSPADTFAGPVTLSGGTLLITSLSSLPAGSIADGGNVQFQLSSAPGGTVANAITGTGGVTQSGAGTTVILTGASSYTGPTTITAGTLGATSDAALGAAPTTATANDLVIFGGATFGAESSFVLNANRGIELFNGTGATASSALIDVAPNSVLTYNGTITDGGTTAGLTKTNMGTLNLGGAATYAGPTVVGNGTLELNFSSASAPTTNVIPSTSKLTLGGINPDNLATTSFSELLMIGKSAGISTQTFASTSLSAGPSVINVTQSGTGGPILFLNQVSISPGAAATFVTPSSGTGGIAVTNTTTINGILGGWATASTGPGTVIDGIIEGFNWATLNSGGAVVPYTSYFVFNNTTTLNKGVTSTENVQINGSFGFVTADSDGADSLTSVNTIAYQFIPTSGDTLAIGNGNTLRLGALGGILKQGTSTNTIYVGGSSLGGPQSGNGTPGSQNIGTLTAASSGTTSQIVLTANGGDQTTPAMIIESAIVNGGRIGLTLVKTGPSLVEIDGMNTYSGGTFIDQGELELGGTNVGVGNPTGLGFGSVTIFPGAYLNLAGIGTNATMNNQFFIAGGGDATEPVGAIRLSSNSDTLAGVVTLTGAARIAGGADANGGTSLAASSVIAGQITGNYALDFGSPAIASDMTLSNPSNNWIGNTTIDGEAGSTAGNTVVHLGATNAIPGGNGFGNLVIGINGDTASCEAVDLNGFNLTINGLASPGATNPSFSAFNTFVENDNAGTVSTLTVGANGQNATFYGIIRDNNSSSSGFGFNPPGGTLALAKIGFGTQILAGVNTYSGGTTIASGDLMLAGGATLGSSSGPLSLSGGTLDLNGNAIAVGSLSGTGGTITTSSGSATLTVNQSGATSFGGTIANATGNLALTIAGNGELTLIGNSAYTGTTTISPAATLAVGQFGQFGPVGQVVTGGVNNSGGVVINAGGVMIVTGGYFQGAGSTSISGLLQVQNGPITLDGGGFAINSLSGDLDLTNSELTLNYAGGASPVKQIAAALRSGYNSGRWNGFGIISSTVENLNVQQNTLVYSVGYADGADGVVAGLSSGMIEVLPTLAGDAKLQGSVNFGDFQILAANFGSSAGWDGGNFTYGSVVNFGDFQLLSQNFGATSSALTGGGSTPLTAGELSSLNSFAAQFGDKLTASSSGVGYSLVSVPEPASVGLLAAAGLGVLGRRLRSRRA